jgi:hypothetical protein
MVLPAILKLKPGAGHEIACRRRYEHLTRSCASGCPRAYMNGDPAGLCPGGSLYLPGVYTSAHLEAELT